MIPTIDNFNISGIDPRTKLAWLVLVIAILFLYDEPIIQFVVAGLVLLVAIIGSISRLINLKSFVGAFKALAAMLIMVVILQGFLRGGNTQLFSIPIFNWRVAFYLEGLIFGLVIASRFITISLAAMMFFVTTSAYQLSIALNKLGLSFKYAYLVSMGLERLPRTIGIMGEIENAQASRGLDIEGGNIWRKIMNVMPVLIPLVISSLREADRMSLALEIRGFGHLKEVSFLYDLDFGKKDIILTILAGFILIAMILLKIQAFLHL